MESLISLVRMRKNMRQFLIFGMKEEKSILTRSKKFSSTEWTKQQNSKNKSKLLSESPMFSKLQNQSLTSLTQVWKTPNMLPVLWHKYSIKYMSQITWSANLSMDFHNSTDRAGINPSNISTIADFSAIFHHTTLPIAECSSISMGINLKTDLKSSQAATGHCTNTNSTSKK